MRSVGGRVVLRFEDLDPDRAKVEWIDRQLEDLTWLGLDWDGPPRRQSTDVARIERAAQTLFEKGLAYPCVCTRKEVQAAISAPHAGESHGAYPGTCRGRFDSLEEAFEVTGRRACLRLRVEPGKTSFTDEIHGLQTLDVEQDAGDFPITRRDGLAAYQLAVVVDDEHDGVTHVLRGDDLVDSTFRQRLLAEALGHDRVPEYWHVPLVVDDAGRRLAKRTQGLSLATLRDEGVSAERLVGWVLRSLGVDVRTTLSASDALELFDGDAFARALRSRGEPERFGQMERGSLGHEGYPRR